MFCLMNFFYIEVMFASLKMLVYIMLIARA